MCIFYDEKKNDNLSFMKKARFEFAMKKTVGNIILMNSWDVMSLELDFLCWDEWKKKPEFIKEVNEYVDKSAEALADGRKVQCLYRKNRVLSTQEENN